MRSIAAAALAALLAAAPAAGQTLPLEATVGDWRAADADARGATAIYYLLLTDLAAGRQTDGDALPGRATPLAACVLRQSDEQIAIGAAGRCIHAGHGAAAPAPTVGADLPAFDTAAHCAEVAAAGGGGSYAVEAGCRRMEAAARTDLAGRAIEPRILAHCTQVATAGGAGSYSVLRGCIRMEERARGQISR